MPTARDIRGASPCAPAGSTDKWKKGRQQVFEVLLKEQNKAGSWQANDGYGPHYATAMAVLALSVEKAPLPDGKEKPEGK